VAMDTAMIVICFVLFIGAVGAIAVWRWKTKRVSKASVPDMEEVEAAEEAVNVDTLDVDGHEMTMEVEIEVNETKGMKAETVTATQD